MRLTVLREPSVRGVTFSAVYVNGAFQCWGLEDVMREQPGLPVAAWKIPGQTAIPSGRYALVLSMSPRFQTALPEVLNVPGFTGIRIHAGNSAEDTDGCLLVGTGRTQKWVTGSRVALAALIERLESVPEDHTITYRNPEAWL